MVQSLREMGWKEAEIFKWLESEKARRDLGSSALQRWAREHWDGFVRHCWMQHLEGKVCWKELNPDEYGLLQRKFQDKQLLLQLIVDQLRARKENLDIIHWALDYKFNMDDVLAILEDLDVNSKRIVPPFDAI